MTVFIIETIKINFNVRTSEEGQKAYDIKNSYECEGLIDYERKQKVSFYGMPTTNNIEEICKMCKQTLTEWTKIRPFQIPEEMKENDIKVVYKKANSLSCGVV